MKRIITILLVFIGIHHHTCGRIITDMAGRAVEIPEFIKTVIPYDNKTNMLLFPIAGNKMIAKAWAGENTLMHYISSDYLSMKEVDLKNAEEVLKLNPDLIIVGTFVNKNTKSEVSKYVKFANKINKPIVVVDLEIMNLDKTYDFLGKLLNLESESSHCSQFIQDIYKDIASYKRDVNSPSAYIANAESGLRTAPTGSIHAQIFDIMGIKNAVTAPMDAKGFSIISIEELMAVNPDYIFCMGKGNSNPYDKVTNNNVWRKLPALQEGKVYKVPSQPFIWFDMPPSINRLCGLIWFNGIFRDQPSDLTQKKITEFYQLFYKYKLNDKEYAALFES